MAEFVLQIGTKLREKVRMDKKVHIKCYKSRLFIDILIYSKIFHT